MGTMLLVVIFSAKVLGGLEGSQLPLLLLLFLLLLVGKAVRSGICVGKLSS